MIEIDKRKQEAEFTQRHTLTPQDFKRMIAEKMERARAYHKAQMKRETAQAQS
jgi:hypothetical protein